jgi:hypothetical protein
MLRATKLATAAVGRRRDLLFKGARSSVPPADGRITLRMSVSVPPRGSFSAEEQLPACRVLEAGRSVGRCDEVVTDAFVGHPPS